jgi:hypothetical protein
LIIDEKPAFDAWLSQQPTFAQSMAETGSLAQQERTDPRPNQ